MDWRSDLIGMARPGSAARRLLARVRVLALSPQRTWEEIAAEPVGIADLFRQVAAPLAAIPAVCRTVGVLVFGDRVMGVGLRPSVGVALAEMAASYGLTLLTAYLIARIVDLIAPTFGGVRSVTAAAKLVIYAASVVWVSGVLLLYPPVGELAGLLATLYGLYLLYLGLPHLMRAAGEHRLTYFAVILLAVITAAVLLGTVTARVRDLGGPLHVAQQAGYASPT